MKLKLEVRCVVKVLLFITQVPTIKLIIVMLDVVRVILNLVTPPPFLLMTLLLFSQKVLISISVRNLQDSL
jgi:hypothetical protein